jgi:hypothetical protein
MELTLLTDTQARGALNLVLGGSETTGESEACPFQKPPFKS